MKYINNQLYIFCVILIVLFTPVILLAAEAPSTFQTIPFLGDGVSGGAEAYANALYRVAISLAAVLAVLRLTLAGFKYMFSEVVTDKGEAKKDIQNALVGLLIILAAITILNTINPQLTNFNFLRSATSVETNSVSGNTERGAKPCEGSSCGGGGGGGL
jgi:hypothetical protein